MMLGTYPCCDGGLMIPMPEKTPAYRQEDCPHCGEKVWHVLSRWDPMSYIEKEFLEIYYVDYENMEISKRTLD